MLLALNTLPCMVSQATSKGFAAFAPVLSPAAVLLYLHCFAHMFEVMAEPSNCIYLAAASYSKPSSHLHQVLPDPVGNSIKQHGIHGLRMTGMHGSGGLTR